jgi:phosphatidylinositol alpha-mannosyltransferase
MLSVSALMQSPSVNVGTFHAYHNRSRSYWTFKPVLKRCLARLHGKITVSKPAMDFVSKYLPGEYCIIPNGIDIERFSPDGPRKEEYIDDKLNILFVGRLEKRKGLEYLIRACGIMKEQYPNFRLIVVGPGTKLRPGYEELVKELKLDNVVFTDFVSQEELPHYYRTADIFCAPATGGESFGIVLLEAMACKKPVVAFDIQGYASVLDHDVEGLLVPVADEKALAQALLTLLQDRSLRIKMGEKGIQKADRFSWGNVSNQVMDYYMSLL